MIQQVDAVYENGVLHPLKPVSLAESQRVRITSSDSLSGHTQGDTELLERAQVEAAAIKHIPHFG